MKTRTVYFAGNDTFKMHVIPLFKGARLAETHNRAKADIIYITYGDHFSALKYFLYWVSNKIIVIHWIGSDVPAWRQKLSSRNFLVRLHYQFRRMMIMFKLNRKQLISLAVTEHLCEGLKKLGIPANLFPITSINNESVKLTEKLFKNQRNIDYVSYIPVNSFEFYGGPLFLECSKKMPGKKFLLIVKDSKEIDHAFARQFPGNVHLIPEVPFEDMQQLLADSKVLLRFTRHDGLSLMVLEALLAQMHVFWTRTLPHTNFVDLAHEHTDKIIERVNDSTANWFPNQAGRSYAVMNYSAESMQERFNSFLSL